MPAPPIRVFLVEDSPIALTILKRILGSSADLEIVGTASNGVDALAAIPGARPDIVCTDFHMPRMGGLELTRRLMEDYPRPILVISASVQEEDTSNVFQILEAGALEVFPKPRTGLSSEYEKNKLDLIHKVKLLAGIKVFTQRKALAPESALPGRSTTAASLPPLKATDSPFIALDIRAPRILAIGASTGGPQALQVLLGALPASFPVPIVCVQHISEGFLPGLASWLNQSCALTVQVAQAGTVPQAGYIYLAPDHYHLVIDAQGHFQLSNQLPSSGHRPSVTVLFNSVAAYYRRSAVGVLLTGMGNDGAVGLQTLAQAGSYTIAQDEESCVVFGMPREAIALGAAKEVLPVQNIAPVLLNRIFRSAGPR
ncbi:chemotaxis-specific protein-glutamate methyltransferase CheB [Prochlorothrix hollandica]|uniref:chemotaxis-specific protein-glutamate methyltransferase CheB n=1 Tax=Prochlorothrix hollandica TaxID=1223 RepID=UPI00334025D3